MNTEWSDMDQSRCPCHGKGWAEVDLDVWKECSLHYEGQLHPHSRVLLLDEPDKLAEEERKSGINYQIKKLRDRNYDLHLEIQNNKNKELALELELINQTPTVRAMPAINFLDGDFI